MAFQVTHMAFEVVSEPLSCRNPGAWGWEGRDLSAGGTELRDLGDAGMMLGSGRGRGQEGRQLLPPHKGLAYVPWYPEGLLCPLGPGHAQVSLQARRRPPFRRRPWTGRSTPGTAGR